MMDSVIDQSSEEPRVLPGRSFSSALSKAKANTIWFGSFVIDGHKYKLYKTVDVMLDELGGSINIVMDVNVNENVNTQENT